MIYLEAAVTFQERWARDDLNIADSRDLEYNSEQLAYISTVLITRACCERHNYTVILIMPYLPLIMSSLFSVQ